MRSKAFVLLAMGLLGFYSHSASALDFNQGFYAAIGLGVAEVDESVCNALDIGGRPGGASQFNCDDSGFAWSLIAGWQVLKWVGIEAGYLDLGEISAAGGGTDVSAEVDGLTLAITPTLPLSEGFSLFARVGGLFWDSDVEGQVSVTQGGSSDPLVIPIDSSDDDTSTFIGAGARASLTERLIISAEWNRYFDIGGTASIQGTNESFTFESDVDQFLFELYRILLAHSDFQ